MNNSNKGKAKYILAFMMLYLFISVTTGTTSPKVRDQRFYKTLTNDTIPVTAKKNIRKKNKAAISPSDTIPHAPSDTSIVDSLHTRPVIDTFDFKISKDSLSAPVVYHADDSMVLDIPGKKILLYGKESTVKYTDNELKAPGIEFDQRTSMVTAFLKRDSVGKVIAFPSFNQGDLKTVSDTIAFNMKSGKGITKGTYTQQDEMYVYAIKIKK